MSLFISHNNEPTNYKYNCSQLPCPDDRMSLRRSLFKNSIYITMQTSLKSSKTFLNVIKCKASFNPSTHADRWLVY